MSITSNQRASLELLHSKRVFQSSYPRHIAVKAEQYLNNILIPVIKSKMKAKDYDQKIIDSVRIGTVDIDIGLGNITYDVICDYISVSNFDISTAREETGTVDHFIKPILKKALHFIARGVEMFSKGHWVKGIIASHIIADTIKELQHTLESKLKDEGDILFERMTGRKL